MGDIGNKLLACIHSKDYSTWLVCKYVCVWVYVSVCKVFCDYKQQNNKISIDFKIVKGVARNVICSLCELASYMM